MDGGNFLGFPPKSVAVVTGAASGIGRATVRVLLDVGVDVAGWDVSREGLEAVSQELGKDGSRFRGYCVDVTDRDRVVSTFAEVGRDFGGAGLLVNNAGPPSGTPFPFDEGLAASLGSVHLVTEAWLSTDASANGTVVNVASVAGAILGVGPTAWYPAAKAGIAGYTRHLALTRPRGIRANAVAPGIVETPRTKALLESPEGSAVIARNPMGRVGRPADVAAAIVFLLSPASEYINGVLLPVDGGNLLTQ
jgi:NAD(P)-dependent dehydrogenase (short-subunit alcohol dehydrogenase family)